MRVLVGCVLAGAIGAVALAQDSPKTSVGRAAAPKTVARVEVPKAPRPDRLAAPALLDQKGLTRTLYQLSVPSGEPSLELVALGKKLFFEVRLSADDTVECATCHDPDKGFTDGRTTAVGIRGQAGHRNAPTVLNALFNETQFWDGRARTLEDQAKLPILNPIEMGQPNPDAVISKLQKTDYSAEFQKVFNRPINYDDLARAIAAYERTQIALDAPFDHFLAGDENALDAAARRGWTIFNGRGRCMSCHQINLISPLGTDNKFHNIGVSAHKSDFVALAQNALKMVDSGNSTAVDRAALETDLSELGRFLVTKDKNDIGAFKTPGLRNVLVTPPYFHDGSQDTLWDVVDHYNKGGVQNPFLDGGINRLGLSESDIDDLVAFMASLTSSRYADLGKKELARQRALSRSRRPQRDTAAADGRKAMSGLTGPWGDVQPPRSAKEKDPALIGGM